MELYRESTGQYPERELLRSVVVSDSLYISLLQNFTCWYVNIWANTWVCLHPGNEKLSVNLHLKLKKPLPRDLDWTGLMMSPSVLKWMLQAMLFHGYSLQLDLSYGVFIVDSNLLFFTIPSINLLPGLCETQQSTSKGKRGQQPKTGTIWEFWWKMANATWFWRSHQGVWYGKSSICCEEGVH